MARIIFTFLVFLARFLYRLSITPSILYNMLESNIFIFWPYLSFKKAFNIFRAHFSLFISSLLKKPLVWGMPYTLNIEVTSRCNLHCRECPVGMGILKRPSGDMGFEEFQAYIEPLKKYLVYLILYFQGEPFLNKDLLEMVRYARDNRIYTMVSTNGHFFNTDEACQQVLDSGLGSLVLSMDGITEETYLTYRRDGDFNRMQEGISRLARLKKEQNRKSPKLFLQFLVLKHNEHEIRQVREFGRVLGVDRVLLKSAQVYNFDEAEDILPADPRYRRYEKGPGGTWQLKGRLKNRCHRLWVNSLVTWDGTVVPCCFDKDAEHPFGSLKKESFNRIWKNRRYSLFRLKVLQDRARIPICTNCTEGIRIYD